MKTEKLNLSFLGIRGETIDSSDMSHAFKNKSHSKMQKFDEFSINDICQEEILAFASPDDEDYEDRH